MQPNNESSYTMAAYDEAASYIRWHTPLEPRVGLILGSGLSSMADQVEDAHIIPYQDIPHFPTSTAPGHVGRLIIGVLAGAPVCVMQGRFHYYEGYSLQQVTAPVRVMKLLGVETLILTNAAGGLNPDFAVGDLMLIEDHINFPGMAGHNPLRGPNLEEFGTRFPSANRTYTKRLRTLADEVAERQGIELRHGVYAAVAGPSFETPAEIRMLRMLGGDAVGMSTVHEALVARHADMEVLGVSTITNQAIDSLDAVDEPTHKEVLEAGKIVVPKLSRLLLGILADLA